MTKPKRLQLGEHHELANDRASLTEIAVTLSRMDYTSSEVRELINQIAQYRATMEADAVRGGYLELLPWRK